MRKQFLNQVKDEPNENCKPGNYCKIDEISRYQEKKFEVQCLRKLKCANRVHA